MKLLTVLFISLLMNSAFADIEESEKICGELGYIEYNYVLMADHGDKYTVREGKLDEDSLEKVTLMSKIVSNHNYDESDYPQACFSKVKAERVGDNELDVLTVGDVELREVTN